MRYEMERLPRSTARIVLLPPSTAGGRAKYSSVPHRANTLLTSGKLPTWSCTTRCAFTPNAMKCRLAKSYQITIDPFVCGVIGSSPPTTVILPPATGTNATVRLKPDETTVQTTSPLATRGENAVGSWSSVD